MFTPGLIVIAVRYLSTPNNGFQKIAIDFSYRYDLAKLDDIKWRLDSTPPQQVIQILGSEFGA